MSTPITDVENYVKFQKLKRNVLKKIDRLKFDGSTPHVTLHVDPHAMLMIMDHYTPFDYVLIFLRALDQTVNRYVEFDPAQRREYKKIMTKFQMEMQQLVTRGRVK